MKWESKRSNEGGVSSQKRSELELHVTEYTHRTSEEKPPGMTIESFSRRTKWWSLRCFGLCEVLGRVVPRSWVTLLKKNSC